MSGALQTSNSEPARPHSVALQAVASARQFATETATAAVETVAFWTAVVLPLAYLPLVVDGLAGSELLPFVALLACNLLALMLGHDHNR